jgi:hypothetical protein
MDHFCAVGAADCGFHEGERRRAKTRDAGSGNEETIAQKTRRIRAEKGIKEIEMLRAPLS